MRYMQLFHGRFANVIDMLDVEEMTAADLAHFNSGVRLLVPYTWEHARARYGDVWDGARFITPPLSEADRTAARIAIEEFIREERSRVPAEASRLAETELLADPRFDLDTGKTRLHALAADKERELTTALDKAAKEARHKVATAAVKWDLPPQIHGLGDGRPRDR